MAPQTSMRPRQQENTEIMEETFSARSVSRCYKQYKLGASHSDRDLQGAWRQEKPDWRLTANRKLALNLTLFS
jgi:hypothetical protein